MSALLTLVLAASSVHLFGIPGGEWITINSEGVVLKRFRELHGVVPDDVAVSPDGKRWAMTKRELDKAPLLYLFEDDGGPPRTLTAKGNVLDGLSFSADGEWILLSANDSQSKRSHGETMSYAQVYKISFNHPVLVPASSSRGCHMWPRFAGRDRVVFAHANCAGGRGLSTLTLSSRIEVDLIPVTNHVLEFAVRPDGNAIFYVVETVAGTEFRLWDLSQNRSELWLQRRVAGPRTRPQWVPDKSGVLFQEGSVISRLGTDGSVLAVAELGGVR